MEMRFAVVPIEDVPVHSEVQAPERPVILVVDDEAIISITLAAILDSSGYAALTARNGAEALELAALVPPDVLVTDLVMQDMNGFDLAVAVRKDVPDCAAILITGQISTAERIQEKRLPGNGFATLCKPVFPAELLACIEQQLAAHGKRPVAADAGSPVGLSGDMAARLRISVANPGARSRSA